MAGLYDEAIDLVKRLNSTGGRSTAPQDYYYRRLARVRPDRIEEERDSFAETAQAVDRGEPVTFVRKGYFLLPWRNPMYRARYGPFDPRVSRRVTLDADGLVRRDRLGRKTTYAWSNLVGARIDRKRATENHPVFGTVEFTARMLALEFNGGSLVLDVSWYLPEFRHPSLLERAAAAYSGVTPSIADLSPRAAPTSRLTGWTVAALWVVPFLVVGALIVTDVRGSALQITLGVTLAIWVVVIFLFVRRTTR